MDLDLVRRLNSPDPAERRAAIITMGKGGNPEDLPLLKQIYQTDPDPALRKLPCTDSPMRGLACQRMPVEVL